MASRDTCPMCGYAFERPDQLAESGGKCPGCGVFLQIPARGETGEAEVRRLPPAPRRVSQPRPAPRLPASGDAGRGKLPWVWVFLAIGALAALLATWPFLSSGPPAPPEVAHETGSNEPIPQQAAEDPIFDELPGEPPGGGTGSTQVSPPEAERAASPSSDSPSAAAESQEGQSLEEVLRAIVKFEVPLSGEARMQYGSGFLVDRRGWIATNNHVLAGATTAARATFADGTEHALAGTVARAPEWDLAIVKLADPPRDRPILSVESLPEPPLGSQVYAFGHPYNAEFSLSKGIVSRVLTTADLLPGSIPQVVAEMNAPRDLVWIQHDARISPGNSGGPLLAEDGRVIGVNTFVHTKAGFGYAGHAQYLRQLLDTATDEVTPLPPAPSPDSAPATSRPGQVVVSVERMKQLYDAGSAFAWAPQRPEQYQTLAELARQMTLAKVVQAHPQASRAHPEAVQNLVGFADQVFLKLRTAGWDADKATAINRYAVDQLDKVGEGAMVFTSVVANVGSAFLLLEVQGTEEYVVVPVGTVLSKSPRGTRWLLIARVTPKTAELTPPAESSPQRIAVLEARYMLRIDELPKQVDRR